MSHERRLPKALTPVSTPEGYELTVNRHGGRSSIARAMTNLLVEHVDPHERTRGKAPEVLDIAAGTGIMTRALLAAGFSVTALDLNPSFLAYLKTVSPEATTIEGDMNARATFRGIQNNTLAGVTTLWSNRYIRRPDEFAAQAYRKLRRDGVLLWPVMRTENAVTLAESMNIPGSPAAIFPDAEHLADIVREQGFSEVSVRKYSLLGSWRAGIRRREILSTPRVVVAKK